MRKLYYFLIVMVVATGVNAQQVEDYEDLKNSRKHNPNSLRPVRDEDIMYSIRVVSRMDMREKINRPWNSEKSKLIELIFEGVEKWYEEYEQSAESISADTAGIRPLSALTDGFLEADLLPKDEYFSNISDPATKSSRDMDQDQEDAFIQNLLFSNPNMTDVEKEDAIRAENTRRATGTRFAPGVVVTLEIEEDLIFDRNHSTSKWDIQTVTVVITTDVLYPNDADLRASSTNVKVVRVRYKDLSRYLRKVYAESDQERGYWFNSNNPGKREISFADAFDLRLFNSWIIQYSNTGGDNLQAILGNPNTDQGRLSILELSQQFKRKLLEYQHNLWEY
ncbi:MAG: gliding motility protein GldN [Roseivirga sp.]|nr:gliding motility protein GldN [Roseivirga sp.]